MSKSYKEQSKIAWGSSIDGNITTNDEIQTGCLQRIADATELIANNYSQILLERDKFHRWYQHERAEKERLQRSIVAHKANYTRLKNKLEAMNQNESENS